jgi:DNA-binding GntR family transcriptional regulator
MGDGWERHLPPAAFSPLTRVGLADQAYAAIKRAVLTGRWRAGVVLSTVDLAEQLGVSRTPVREAVRLLAERGILEADTKGQFKVRDISDAEATEIFLLRAAVEALTMRTLARRFSSEHAEHLRQLVALQESVHDPAEFLELDQQFHWTIAHGAGLPLAARFLVDLRERVQVLGGLAIVRPGRQPEVIAEHRAILGALEVQDAEAAVAALGRHLIATAKSLGRPGLDITAAVETALGGPRPPGRSPT